MELQAQLIELEPEPELELLHVQTYEGTAVTIDPHPQRCAAVCGAAPGDAVDDPGIKGTSVVLGIATEPRRFAGFVFMRSPSLPGSGVGGRSAPEFRSKVVLGVRAPPTAHPPVSSAMRANPQLVPWQTEAERVGCRPRRRRASAGAQRRRAQGGGRPSTMVKVTIKCKELY